MAGEGKPVGKWHGHTSSEVKTRYNAKQYEVVSFRLRRDGGDFITKGQISEAAAAQHMSVNQWIIEAIRDKLY